jgi:hypothetical protein
MQRKHMFELKIQEEKQQKEKERLITQKYE